MITTVFPAYQSVQSAVVAPTGNTSSAVSSPATGLANCTMDNPSNIYVAVLIGSKYCTELFSFPIVGWFADKYHPPLILFYGALVEALSCVLYSVSDNFYSSMLARVVDAIGYSVVATSGLTLIYTIYLTERPRNRIVTIDSILVSVAASVSPLIAGSVFESAAAISHHASRIFTFMMMCPLFLFLAIAIAPFAFEMSYLSMLGRVFCRPRDDPMAEKNAEAESLNCPDSPPEYESKDDDKTEEKIDKIDKTDETYVKTPLNIITLMKDPHIVIVLCGLLFNSLVYNSLETTLPIFMIRKFCSDQTQQGVVWMFGFLSLLGFTMASFLFHYKPKICWILPMIGIVSTGSFCVAVAFSNPWWVIGICLGLLAFFVSLTEVILIPIIPQIIDVKYDMRYGSGSGLTLVTYTISGIIGSFPMGPLVEQWGFLTMCVILFSINCVVAPFIYFLRTYFNQPPTKPAT